MAERMRVNNEVWHPKKQLQLQNEEGGSGEARDTTDQKFTYLP
jgi:hypothetical protein